MVGIVKDKRRQRENFVAGSKDTREQYLCQMDAYQEYLASLVKYLEFHHLKKNLPTGARRRPEAGVDTHRATRVGSALPDDYP